MAKAIKGYLMPTKNNASYDINTMDRIRHMPESVQVLWDIYTESQNDFDFNRLARHSTHLKCYMIHIISIYLIGHGLRSSNDLHVELARKAYNETKPGLSAVTVGDLLLYLPPMNGYNIYIQRAHERMYNIIGHRNRDIFITIMMKVLDVLNAPDDITGFVKDLLLTQHVVDEQYNATHSRMAWADTHVPLAVRISSWDSYKNKKDIPSFHKTFKRFVEKSIQLSVYYLYGLNNIHMLADLKHIMHITRNSDMISVPYADLSLTHKLIFDCVNDELFSYMQEEMVCDLADAIHNSLHNSM